MEVNHSAVGPGVEDLLGGGVGLGECQHFVEAVIDQGHAGEGAGGLVGQFGILEGIDQRGHVVATQHGAEDLDRLFLGDQRGLDGTGHDAGEKSGLNLGILVVYLSEF